ncbi:hypothetical protein CFC21_006365 [Triticum aestivum]|uniref:Uncharacterized protein n=2 Tax=Triticum aestivum TaxID=4565 RepID=A0A9R1DBN7_WHEAT|nr:hypothetical protein CFC21_006365 [Triticum aestivum]
MKLGSLLTIFFLTYTRNAVGQKKQIEMLIVKLRMVDVDLASGRWKAKISKSHGRVLYLSLRDEKARLLGNLVWAYMQPDNYEEAEMLYKYISRP